MLPPVVRNGPDSFDVPLQSHAPLADSVGICDESGSTKQSHRPECTSVEIATPLHRPRRTRFFLTPHLLPSQHETPGARFVSDVDAVEVDSGWEPGRRPGRARHAARGRVHRQRGDHQTNMVEHVDPSACCARGCDVKGNIAVPSQRRHAASVRHDSHRSQQEPKRRARSVGKKSPSASVPTTRITGFQNSPCRSAQT